MMDKSLFFGGYKCDIVLYCIVIKNTMAGFESEPLYKATKKSSYGD